MNIEKGYYSQNYEQENILNALGDSGRFLDVGAYTGKEFSNTLALFEKGWTGVLLEPSPAAFKALEKTYAGEESRATLINAAITLVGGPIKFFDSGGDAISSTSEAHKERWEKGYKCEFKEITVDSFTWEQIFKLHGKNYDFVSIDTESTNMELLGAFPFETCKPKVLCVEYDGKCTEMEMMLHPLGYKTIYVSGENLVVSL